MKKAFAMFLTIAIALTLLPTAALAAGGWYKEISGLETSSKYNLTIFQTFSVV